jgi:predicted kinase
VAEASALTVPADALVVLIGAAGSGKSTFAARNFPPDAIVSSDALRARRSPAAWKARTDVFNQLLPLVEASIAEGTLTVVDATNADWMRRSELIGRAREHGRLALAIVFAIPVEDSIGHNRARESRVPAATIRRHAAAIERDLDRLDLEGFATVWVFRTSDQAAAAQVQIKKGPEIRAPR